MTVVYEKCAVLGYCATSSGDFLPTFRDDLSAPIFKGQESKEITQSFFGFLAVEDGTDRLSRKVCKKSIPFFWIRDP